LFLANLNEYMYYLIADGCTKYSWIEHELGAVTKWVLHILRCLYSKVPDIAFGLI